MKPARWLQIALTALLLTAGLGAWAASGQVSTSASPTATMKAMDSAMGHDCCENTDMTCCQDGHDQCGPGCATSHCSTAPVALVPMEPVTPQPARACFRAETGNSWASRITPPLTPPPLV